MVSLSPGALLLPGATWVGDRFKPSGTIIEKKI